MKKASTVVGLKFHKDTVTHLQRRIDDMTAQNHRQRGTIGEYMLKNAGLRARVTELRNARVSGVAPFFCGVVVGAVSLAGAAWALYSGLFL